MGEDVTTGGGDFGISLHFLTATGKVWRVEQRRKYSVLWELQYV